MGEQLINLTANFDIPTVSSRQVAEDFEKQHGHVLRDIEAYKRDVSSFGEMFFETYEPDSYERPQRTYQMTRDGFSLLAMGFTGQKALEWKIKYISAFNAIEKNWNSPEKVMARALQIADRQIKSLTEKTDYQQQLITGLTGAISLDQKRQILNKVMRKGFGSADQQRDRWGALYQHFEMIHHCDVDQRIANWQDRMCKAWKKSKLDFVDKQMGMLDELYTVAVKLFETDVETVKRQLFVA